MIISSGSDETASSGVTDRELFTVATLVDNTLTDSLRWPRFPERLEGLFERETGATRVRHMIVAGLVAISIYDLFLFSDYTMVPGIIGNALVVRLGIITPMAILVMVAQARGLSPSLREGLGAGITVCSCAGLAYLLMLSQEPNAAYYVYGLILSIMFGNIVLRLHFFYAAATSLIIVIIYTASTLATLHVVPITQINNIIVLCSTGILTTFANYTLERDHRFNYLLRLRDRIQRATLTAHNAHLTQLAHIDSLTGVVNRRGLDDYLAQLQQGSPTALLAIIMFDIDHFKLYNDRYGHPAGDECLRRVAGVLLKSLHRSNDMVARFGGEEFVIVMPGANMQTAHLVAERMRQAVLDLAIPHATSPTTEIITVSGGVAAANLSADVQAILTAADTALYRAKSAGRNCVEQLLPLGE
jgi:diguanylate cyclase (GGDEF)-like protein